MQDLDGSNKAIVPSDGVGRLETDSLTSSQAFLTSSGEGPDSGIALTGELIVFVYEYNLVSAKYTGGMRVQKIGQKWASRGA